MKAEDIKLRVVKNYLELVRALSTDMKLELISRLSDSLKSRRQGRHRSLGELYGAFISEKSAREIELEVRQSRHFNRKSEPIE
jgi:hypothetical protein